MIDALGLVAFRCLIAALLSNELALIVLGMPVVAHAPRVSDILFVIGLSPISSLIALAWLLIQLALLERVVRLLLIIAALLLCQATVGE